MELIKAHIKCKIKPHVTYFQIGYEEMDAAYITELENLANNPQCSKDQLGKRYEQIARILYVFINVDTYLKSKLCLIY